MRRLMQLMRYGRLDLTPLLTHTFPPDRITEAYQLIGERRDNVIKVAVRPYYLLERCFTRRITFVRESASEAVSLMIDVGAFF